MLLRFAIFSEINIDGTPPRNVRADDLWHVIHCRKMCLGGTMTLNLVVLFYDSKRWNEPSIEKSLEFVN